MELLAGTYQPQLIRGIKIPKGNGDFRQLGIPTVMDRLVQQSIHQVMSPVWEREFSNYSFGFRPKRNAHQALAKATEYINSGKHWIIDLDLKSFFDRVNHDHLMSLISKKVTDKTLLKLIGKRCFMNREVRDPYASWYACLPGQKRCTSASFSSRGHLLD